MGRSSRPKHKLENFDFHEVTEHLTNTVTDRVYREYRPDLKGEYEKRKAAGLDADLDNDLVVPDELIAEIKAKIESELKEKITASVASEVERELKEQYHPNPDSFESQADRFVKSVRWIALLYMAPIFVVMLVLGLVVSVETLEVGYLAKEYIVAVFEGFGSNKPVAEDGSVIYKIAGREILNLVVAAILSILDLILVGSLVIMVLVGGYENTIARIGMTHDVPTWFGKLDISQLKIKVAASIVIISSIHLLMGFMQLDVDAGDSVNYDAYFWTTVIHGVFVVSAFTLAVMEYVNRKSKH